ncbi:MAG: serine/threonine-protein phosphatase, partial [Eubacterium sp.]|nr:serine/threonine-protein phosphatase [Eubacterium sp.]
VIADVSGKGIPAALFMMKAKAVIKSAAEEGLHVEEILYRANNTLSEGNKADMFVTCWIGKIDLDTGHLECTSAGHNPALLAGKDQEFSYQKIKVGFVLGGMEEMIYKRTEYDMQPGDTIFLYTDGVTEAHNKDEKLFGDDRLLEVINRYQDEKPEGICEGVLKELGEYIGEADQFDDITMVCFRYHPPKEEAEGSETEKQD